MLCFIFVFLKVAGFSATNHGLSCVGWNMRCRFSTSVVFFHETIFSHDIACISEHGLYKCELKKLDHLHPDFLCHAMPSKHLDDSNFGKPNHYGIGGTAIFWKKSLASRVKVMRELCSDRFCVIQFVNDTKQKIYFISMYLPHQTCKIDSFYVTLLELRRICETCLSDGEVVCIGDSNCNLSSAYGIRGCGITTSNAKSFASVMTQLDMVIADLTKLCSGEKITWTSDDGLRKSYIDHICVSRKLLPFVEKCNVLPDSISNISDHVPISVTMKFSVKQGPDPILRQVVDWNKAEQEDRNKMYTAPLENDLICIMESVGCDLKQYENIENVIVPGCGDFKVVSDLLSKIVMSMLWHSSHLPLIEFNKHSKPFWTKQLDDLFNCKDKALKEWGINGRIKSEEDESFNVLKCAKKCFKKEHKKCTRNYDISNMKDFAMSGDLDQRYFWYIVNRYRKVFSVSPVRSDSGEIITDPIDIANEWGVYFRNLFDEKDNPEWDADFKEYVDENVERISKIESAQLRDGPICVDEVIKMLKCMKNGRASGWDQISAEHLKYGGYNLILCLTWLFNSFVLCERIPEHCKKGIMVPIPKPGKDCSVKDNNRGITLLTVIYKLFEKVLMEREKEWFCRSDVCDKIQSAGQDKCSSLHTSFLVQECVSYNVNRGCSVYGGSLDTAKAFDSVWINGLLYKLYELGIDLKVWKLIRNAYSGFKCAVNVNGQSSDWFDILRGVHQGAPFSMKLYIVYVNCMISFIRESCYGATIGYFKVGAPAHADDVFILVLYKCALNYCFDIAVKYSRKWRYDFNYDKTKVLLWGKDTDPNIDIVMNETVIDINVSAKHMGVMLCTDKKSECIAFEERVGSAKSVLMAARGMGNDFAPMAPSILSKLYWSMCIPKLVYGLEVTNVDDENICLLETAHRINAKNIQGIPLTIPTPAPLATLGWLSITSYVDIQRIMFLIRTCGLPDDNMYKQVMIYRINCLRNDNELRFKMKSPVYIMLQSFKKYGLYEMLLDCIDKNEFGNVIEWKKLVKKSVWNMEYMQWKVTCNMYAKLCIYKHHVTEMKLHPWWEYVKFYPFMFKKVSAVLSVLMGDQPRGIKIFDQARCQICNDNKIDCSFHVLFECITLEDIRNPLLYKLYACMSVCDKEAYDSMIIYDKLCYILSGFSPRYNKSYDAMYRNAANFVYSMYYKRFELYDASKMGVT